MGSCDWNLFIHSASFADIVFFIFTMCGYPFLFFFLVYGSLKYFDKSRTGWSKLFTTIYDFGITSFCILLIFNCLNLFCDVSEMPNFTANMQKRTVFSVLPLPANLVIVGILLTIKYKWRFIQ